MATSTVATNAIVTSGDDVIIPLLQLSRYTFQIELESETYQFAIHWNLIDEHWYLDILGISVTEDIKGIRLVTGPNLIKPYAILTMGGLYIIDITGAASDPDFENMGIRYKMYYVPTNTSNPAKIL
jgi:hypothetical protein